MRAEIGSLDCKKVFSFWAGAHHHGGGRLQLRNRCRPPRQAAWTKKRRKPLSLRRFALPRPAALVLTGNLASHGLCKSAAGCHTQPGKPSRQVSEKKKKKGEGRCGSMPFFFFGPLPPQFKPSQARREVEDDDWLSINKNILLMSIKRLGSHLPSNLGSVATLKCTQYARVIRHVQYIYIHTTAFIVCAFSSSFWIHGDRILACTPLNRQPEALSAVLTSAVNCCDRMGADQLAELAKYVRLTASAY